MQSIVLIANCNQLLNLIDNQCKEADINSYKKEN